MYRLRFASTLSPTGRADDLQAVITAGTIAEARLAACDARRAIVHPILANLRKRAFQCEMAGCRYLRLRAGFHPQSRKRRPAAASRERALRCVRPGAGRTSLATGAAEMSPLYERVLEIADIRSEVIARRRTYDYELIGCEPRAATGAGRERLRGAKRAGNVVAITCRHSAGNLPFAVEDRLIDLGLRRCRNCRFFARAARLVDVAPCALVRDKARDQRPRCGRSDHRRAGHAHGRVLSSGRLLYLARRAHITAVRLLSRCDSNRVVVRFGEG